MLSLVFSSVRKISIISTSHSLWRPILSDKEGRECIDGQLTVLKEVMRSLNSQRNDFTAAARLPGEALEQIFLLYGMSCRDSEPPCTGLRCDNLCWIAVSHVCQHWRAVALGCSELWCHISFRSDGITRMMLERSDPFPIDIMHCRHQSPPISRLQAALAHISRVRTIDLVTDRLTYVVQLLCTSLQLPAPALSSLSLGASQDDYLSHYLFSISAPALQSLTLFHCDLRWDWPLLRQLTHLEYRPYMWGGRSTVEEVTAALSNMTHLRTLYLESALEDTNAEEYLRHKETARPVALPMLDQLYLGDEPYANAALLVRLDLPADVKLDLKCSKTQTSFDPQRGQTLNVGEVTAVAHGSTRHLWESGRSFQKLIVKADDWSRELMVPSGTDDDEESLLWRSYWPVIGINVCDGFLDSLCGIIPLSELQELAIDFGLQTLGLDLRTTFGNIPGLRLMQIKHPHALSIVCEILEPARNANGDSLSGIDNTSELFPALQEVRLCTPCPDSPPSDEELDELFESLGEKLSIRSAQGKHMVLRGLAHFDVGQIHMHHLERIANVRAFV